MGYLWFDPRAEVASHVPVYSRVDPSRPIKRKPKPVEPNNLYGMYGIYIAAESDAA
jgi:hypothetical protein